jgi:hypothetical protein
VLTCSPPVQVQGVGLGKSLSASSELLPMLDLQTLQLDNCKAKPGAGLLHTIPLPLCPATPASPAWVPPPSASQSSLNPTSQGTWGAGCRMSPTAYGFWAWSPGQKLRARWKEHKAKQILPHRGLRCSGASRVPEAATGTQGWQSKAEAPAQRTGEG